MLMQNFLKNFGNSNRIAIKQNDLLINLTQVRYRKPVYFRKYHQPGDFRKKVLLAVCEPIYPTDRRSTLEKCSQLIPKPPKPDHPYDVLLAKDMQKFMDESRLVCFFHQNQMDTRARKMLKNEYEHENMFLRYYNRDIARICWKNTRFESLLHFAPIYEFTILFVPENAKIDKIIKIAKKYPEVHIMAALIDNRRLLTLKQLELLSKIPNLDEQRAMLHHNLNMLQRNLLQSLSYHTSELSRMLNTHSKEKEGQSDNM